MSSRVPVRAGTDADFVELGTGGGEGSAPWACARRAAGEVKCWGSDSFGVLGDGAPSTAQPSPAAIVGPADCIALAVGDTNACVLDGAGAAWCWGRNDHGQLGTEAFTPVPLPSQVPGAPTSVAVSVGSDDVYVLDAEGTV